LETEIKIGGFACNRDGEDAEHAAQRASRLSGMGLTGGMVFFEHVTETIQLAKASK